jgi:hypothetical protein
VEAVGKGCVSCGRGGGSGETGARQSGGNRGLNTVSTGGRRCSDRAADEWAPTVSDFSNLFKIGSNLKIKMDALIYSKNSHFFMWLEWDMMKKFLNCADIKFPT